MRSLGLAHQRLCDTHGLGQDADGLEHPVHTECPFYRCAHVSLPSHPFDAEEPIASGVFCRRSSRMLTRVAENRSDEPKQVSEVIAFVKDSGGIE